MATTEQRTLTGLLADFVLDTDSGALPGEVVHTTKRAVLDLLGCALAGATVEELDALVGGIKAYDRGADAAIWGRRERASVSMAAMANGTAAHARELDDGGGPGHPGSVVVPAALVVGEANRRSGREVLAAIALGYETLFRIVDGAGGYRPIVMPGWHPIGVTGGFGGAAAAGKLLGLDRRQLTWALGLAGSFSGGSWAFIRDGAMSKRWHPGRAAANGVEAAYLARAGFTGPTEILEAPWGGFYGAHFPNASLRLDAVTAGLGTDFRMLETRFKPYACCRGIHAYLEAFARLVGEHRLGPGDIAAVEVEGTEREVRMLGKGEVSTMLDGQMSLGYTLAVVAHTGRATLAEYSPRWLGDPGVRQLAGEVSIVVRPELEEWGREVRVRLKNGEMVSTRTETPLGYASHPISDADLAEKFRGLATPTVGPARAESIVEAVWGFERIEDVATFCRLLVP